MNRDLTNAQADACLQVLYLGLIAIRSAARAGDLSRAS